MLRESSALGCDVDVILWMGRVSGDLGKVLLLPLLYLLVFVVVCERVCASAVVRVVNVCVCGCDGCD